MNSYNKNDLAQLAAQTHFLRDNLEKVLQLTENRLGAKLVPEIMENVTTPDQYELLEMNRISGFVNRARGTGRPTKKERRELDDFVTPAFFGDFEDFDFDDDDDEEDFE